MSTTPPAPPPGPPPAPPPGPPSASPPAGAPAAAPTKRGGGSNIWLILFIVAGVLFVGALIFAIISFTGKSSAEDDKDKAQKELASTKKELATTKSDLGTSQGASQILGNLVTTGAKSADDLKTCSDTARQFAIDVLQSGGNIGQPLVDEAGTVDSRCGTSDQSYQAFIDALNKVKNR
jgi:cytoskeletal protein RodZ